MLLHFAKQPNCGRHFEGECGCSLFVRIHVDVFDWYFRIKYACIKHPSKRQCVKAGQIIRVQQNPLVQVSRAQRTHLNVVVAVDHFSVRGQRNSPYGFPKNINPNERFIPYVLHLPLITSCQLVL